MRLTLLLAAAALTGCSAYDFVERTTAGNGLVAELSMQQESGKEHELFALKALNALDMPDSRKDLTTAKIDEFISWVIDHQTTLGIDLRELEDMDYVAEHWVVARGVVGMQGALYIAKRPLGPCSRPNCGSRAAEPLSALTVGRKIILYKDAFRTSWQRVKIVGDGEIVVRHVSLSYAASAIHSIAHEACHLVRGDLDAHRPFGYHQICEEQGFDAVRRFNELKGSSGRDRTRVISGGR